MKKTKTLTTTEKTINPENKSSIFDQAGELVIDVYQTDNDFIITSAVAGITIKDIDISVDKDMMIIKGHRPEPDANLSKKYFYQECYWGPFTRKIILPTDINIENTSAEMEKGILTIKIPKIVKAEKEKVDIKDA